MDEIWKDSSPQLGGEQNIIDSEPIDEKKLRAEQERSRKESARMHERLMRMTKEEIIDFLTELYY